MRVQVLIESVVQQTTVLLAKLATAGGARAPLAHIASQVFVELASELERQGVSRKVTADMFGISLRAYQRKMQRLKESDTDRGRSLWEAILSFLRASSVVTRKQVLARFQRDDQDSVKSILHDLVESGLVFATGTRADDVYRAASPDELGAMQQLDREGGVDELLWSLIFCHGPLERERLADMAGVAVESLEAPLTRLLQARRIEQQSTDGVSRLYAERFYIAEGAEAGWEAAIYDHYRAVVRTLCNRLEPDEVREPFKDSIGGSTYTFDVGPGHPLESEVLGLLERLRNECRTLRQRVATHNAEHGRTQQGENVVVYVGQSVLAREDLDYTDRDLSSVQVNASPAEREEQS